MRTGLSAGADSLSLDTAPSLAKFLNVSVACIRKYTLRGMPCVRIGHAVRFDRQEVLAWLKARQQQRQQKGTQSDARSNG